MGGINPVSERFYMGSHMTIPAGKEVVDYAVLHVRNNGGGLYPGTCFMGVQEVGQLIGFIDNAGSHFHGGDDLVRTIDCPVRLIAEMSILSMAHHGGIRIGRRDVPVVERGTGIFLQSLLQFVIRLVETAPFDKRTSRHRHR